MPGDAARRFRILALDVDGTLLDGRSLLRQETAEAVARAAGAGIRPVLCTGRRYRRARPIADALGIDAPLVCNSGAVVKEPRDHSTLWRAELDPKLVFDVATLFRARGEPTVTFTDQDPELPDLLVDAHPTGRPLLDEYVALNLPYAGIAPGWERQPDLVAPHFHLCAVGERAAMLDLEAEVVTTWPHLVRTFVQKSPRYAGTMCEVIRHDASKWSAVLHVAELWGVDPSEICAVGDDMNDVPMLVGAGLGVAMGHAPEPVRAAADLVIGDHDSDGLARLIDEVLLAPDRAGER